MNWASEEEVNTGTTPWTKEIDGAVFNDTVSFNVNDHDLAAFIGTGNVSFDLIGDATTQLAVAAGSNTFRIHNVEGSGFVTVTYDYVPEPATIALLGLGGLVLMKKKRSA